jgi:hypothetical protein
LLAKAGVKVSAEQLRARASPTGPRRSDMKLDAKSAASEGSSLCGDEHHDAHDAHDPHDPHDTDDLSQTRYDAASASPPRESPYLHFLAVSHPVSA